MTTKQTSNEITGNNITVGLVQMSPVWLNRLATTEKMLHFIDQAHRQNCKLVVFGEGLLPGYPFWLELTDGASFNSETQKKIHAHYCQQAVNIERGDLDIFCQKAKQYDMSMYLGVIERPEDRGGHSLYCSLVYINQGGEIQSVHRKLMPTYEERLAWSIGDGHGLVTHSLGDFTVGGLNCWENWMPLARTSLYAQGENLHVAVWPGNLRNTEDLTPMMAKEGRSFVISVSGLMQMKDFPENTPYYDLILKGGQDKAWLANGGSCVCSPDGDFLLEPQVETEGLFTAVLDKQKIYQERQNFDPVGHYSRPDVFQLKVNKERQGFDS